MLEQVSPHEWIDHTWELRYFRDPEILPPVDPELGVRLWGGVQPMFTVKHDGCAMQMRTLRQDIDFLLRNLRPGERPVW